MTIRFNEPYMTGREKDYLAQVIDNRFFSGNGPFTKRVHKLLEEKYGVPHVLLTHSCTAALEMAALLFDVGPGDEVIVPSYTFVSTASAFMRTGAKLVFCEVDPRTMNLDPSDAISRITPRTRAIAPIHYGGIGADLEPLLETARARKIRVVEDAAQGLGARSKGRWLGTMAELGAFSFHETKNIHCGLGGALFVNDASLFDRAEDIWERGTNRTKMFRGMVDKYSWVELGSSFYPSEFQAAFLLAQLEEIDRNLAERKVIYERYDANLRGKSWKTFTLPEIPAGSELNSHSYFIYLESRAACDALIAFLRERQIHAYIGYVPLHRSTMGEKLGYRREDLPVTADYAERVLRLPFHHMMSVQDVDRVCEGIANFDSGRR